jgi:myosin heavy subunit
MHIVNSMHLDQREAQLGNTKVFIKSPESVSHYQYPTKIKSFNSSTHIFDVRSQVSLRSSLE